MNNEPSDLLFAPMEAAQEALRSGVCTSETLTEQTLKHIQESEEFVHAFLKLDPEGAIKAARESDARRSQGKPVSPLDGIPVSVKDLIVTRGIETTAASKMLEGYIPPYDATVVAKLREAGAIILGKTNLDEFAMGSSTEHSAFGATHNPHDLSRVPGGSSGGSAAAVAAGQCFASLGTDTGGSIRQPAAFCGVTGLKPTYGRVSRFGAIAFASSLDQIGPMARSARGVAEILQVIAGHDERDSTSSPSPTPDYLSQLSGDAKGLRIGMVQEAFAADGLDQEISKSVHNSALKLKEAGAEIVDVSIPSLPLSVATYYLTCTAEASSNLARYDGVRYGPSRRVESHSDDLLEMYKRRRSEGFGAEVKRRIILGTYALSAGYYDAYYLKAQKVRTIIKNDFSSAFEKCDALLLPTSPVAPFKLGEKLSDPLQMYLADIYTIACNLAGLPGLSMPAGLSTEALPIGTQLIAPAMEEGRLLRLADAHEKYSDSPWSAPEALRQRMSDKGGAK